MTLVVAALETSGLDGNMSHKESINENGTMPNFEETLQKIDEELGITTVTKDAISKSVKGHNSFEFQLVQESTPFTDVA